VLAIPKVTLGRPAALELMNAIEQGGAFGEARLAREVVRALGAVESVTAEEFQRWATRMDALEGTADLARCAQEVRPLGGTRGHVTK